MSHLIKFAILIGQNDIFDYIGQGNYCIIETRQLFLTAISYKTLKQNF